MNPVRLSEIEAAHRKIEAPQHGPPICWTWPTLTQCSLDENLRIISITYTIPSSCPGKRE